MDNRMFDFEKYYDKMAEELPEFSRIVEVGVADGASAIYLAKKLKEAGRKQFALYMVDNLAYGGPDQLSEIIKNVMESGCSEYIQIIPMDSLNASCKFNDGSLDFVFLDSSHTYTQTKAEIMLWYKKVTDGGILAGHDYSGNQEVHKAVNEMLPKEIIRPPIINEKGERVMLDKFPIEKFLFSEDTKDKNGVWFCEKVFHFKPA